MFLEKSKGTLLDETRVAFLTNGCASLDFCSINDCLSGAFVRLAGDLELNYFCVFIFIC